jgi:hypothetical protein
MTFSKTETQTTTQTNADGTVEVLYQKMGDRWFAFSLINDEVFVGSITQTEIDSAEKTDLMKLHPTTGNS